MANLRVGPLVRAIHPNGVAIWTEWSDPCDVTLTAAPSDHLQKPEPGTFSVCSRTVTVGKRHYALSLLTNLEPSTWYRYRVSDLAQEREASSAQGTIIQCFRTLDLPNAGNTLRLAYGSCRKLSDIEPDALSALGDWLLRFLDEREAFWPHILLLIGDQIYADDSMEEQKQRCSPLLPSRIPPHPAQAFEDFARIYVEAWAGDEGIRQVLATLPTYMILDDHEITNNYNISPTWQARVLQEGGEQMLVDGLVAYWVYQGWGNLGLQRTDRHDLLAIMQQAAQSGEDALEALQLRIRQTLYAEKALQWDYVIPTTPPIFVTDVRTNRSAIQERENHADVIPRIMSQEQMLRLRSWMQEYDASTVLLVSSVPVLLPPAIGFAEYAMGVRPLQNVSSGFLRRLGQMLASGQQLLAERLSFEHWPVFGATWHELIELLSTHKRDLVILSGDVHFSYAMSARPTFLHAKRHTALYQLVASPFRNTLGRQEKRLIVGQAWIKRALYGGLYSRMLPLALTKAAKRAPADMLFQNVVAFVTFWPQTQEEGKYDIRQVYLGMKDKALEKVASIVVNSK